MKKYIAGSFDALRLRQLQREPSSNKYKITVSVKNLTFAQFLQNKIKLTCKNLTKSKGEKRGYYFMLTKRSIQEILNYCGEYIVNHQDIVNDFYENENITKPKYKKHIDNRDYLAGAFDSIINFIFHRGSGKSVGRYNFYTKIVNINSTSQYVLKFLNNNNIKYSILNTCYQKQQLTFYKNNAEKLLNLMLDELISKKEVAAEFLNLPEKIDLTAGDLFKEKIQFKIHPSIIPKKGLTIEESTTQALKNKSHRTIKKQILNQEKKDSKEYILFLRALYNEQKREARVYASQKIKKNWEKQAKILKKQKKLKKINATHRICTACNLEKPKSEFYKNPKIAYGCDSVCKQCRSRQSLAYYTQNKEKHLKCVKKWRQNNRVSSSQHTMFRELSETHDFVYFPGQGVKKEKLEKYFEQEYLKLPQKIKEKYNLPKMLSAKEIFDLRSKGVLHFDHIFPKAYIKNEIKTGKYTNYTISPHIYKNLRPFPSKLNMSRSCKLDYLEYYTESELQDKRNAVFKV